MNTTTCDILIVGGGSAGVAAAVSASQEGYNVCLLERNAYLGGKATASEVGTICGLYKFSKNQKTEFVTHGFAKDFALKLSELSLTIPLHNQHGLHYLPYEIEDYKVLCSQLLHDNNVRVYFESEAVKVETNNNRLTKVVIKVQEEETHFLCKSVIDCSGNSCISRLTSAPLITSSNYQAAAQVFTLNGIQAPSELALGLLIIKEIKKAVLQKMLSADFERLYLVQGSLKNNTASFKLAIPLSVTLQQNNELQLRQTGLDMINQLVNYLTKHVDSFKHAQLLRIAPEIGIRVGVRPVGKYLLTETDVLTCRKFEEGIANGAWPIEEWNDTKHVKMRYFNFDDFYQIPADCLKSVQLHNLFFAGRNISADDAAIASARVMGICFQTGFAAGKLCANYLSGKPEITAIQAIRQKQVLIPV